MFEYVLLAVAAVVVVILLVLRTNAAISFFALCAGSVLVNSSGDNMGLIASSVTSGMGSAANIAKIVLLFLPMIISSFLLRGQVPKSLFLLNLLPAICAGFLAVLFTVPLLPETVRQTVTSNDNWAMLVQYQEFVIGVGLFVSIILISATTKHHKEKHKKH